MSISTTGASAQGCTDLSIPLNDFDLPRDTLSDDGLKILLTGRENSAPISTTREAFLFDTQTQALTQLTRDTPAATNLRGEMDLSPVMATAITGDSSRVFLRGSARQNFPNFTPPGLPFGQYEEIIGTPGRAEILDVASGARIAVGLLANEPLAQDEVYTATISAVSNDGKKAFLNESINVIVRFTVNGVQRNYVSFKRRVAGGVLDLESLQYTDIASRIAALVGPPGAFPSGSAGVSFLMSGDGNAFAFDSGRRLEVSGGPFWPDVIGNTAGVRTAPYVYFLDRNVVEPITRINFGAARTAASSFNFVRNIGQTGTIFGIDRGASYEGAPLNSSGANAPALARVGAAAEYLFGAPQTIPLRGQFVNTGTYVSQDERRIYFSSADDLVPGQNPARSQELFSFEIATRQIRQISRLQDGLTAAFASDPDTLRLLGDDRQIIFLDASSDGRTVVYLVAGGVQNASIRRLADGRINLVFPNLGSAELPASQLYRVARCN